jgi:hypothetical protein
MDRIVMVCDPVDDNVTFSRCNAVKFRCPQNWTHSHCIDRIMAQTEMMNSIRMAEPFLRSQHLISHAGSFQYVVETKGSLLCSQELSTGFMLRYMNQVHNPQPVSLRFILILCSHLCVAVPSGLFPSGSLSTTHYALHIMRAMCPAHIILLDSVSF